MNADTSSAPSGHAVDHINLLVRMGGNIVDHPDWEGSLRGVLLDLIERVVVNRQALEQHIRDIRGHRLEDLAFTRRTEREHLLTLRDEGVRGRLSDRDLVDLVRDTYMLEKLAVSLCEGGVVAQEAWHQARIRDAKLLHQEHGIVPPSLDDLKQRVEARRRRAT